MTQLEPLPDFKTPQGLDGLAAWPHPIEMADTEDQKSKDGTENDVPAFQLPQDQQESNGDWPNISETIQDELQWINTKFGEGTWEIQSRVTTPSRLVMLKTRLRVPHGLLIPADLAAQAQEAEDLQEQREEAVYLQISLPSTYPRVGPEVDSIEAPFRQGEYAIGLVMALLVAERFDSKRARPMAHILDLAQEQLACLNQWGRITQFLADAVSTFVLPDATTLMDSLDWTKNPHLDRDMLGRNVKFATGLSECAGCCGQFTNLRIIRFQCGCHRCKSCFKYEWKYRSKALKVWDCCGTRVDAGAIRAYTDSTYWDYNANIDKIRARNSSDPLFCPYPNCTHFIGSLREGRFAQILKTSSNVECPQCKHIVCLKCKSRRHDGDCVIDEGLINYLKENDVRRCVKCNYGIEKDEGCKHVICEICGTDMWWSKDAGGTVELLPEDFEF